MMAMTRVSLLEAEGDRGIGRGGPRSLGELASCLMVQFLGVAPGGDLVVAGRGGARRLRMYPVVRGGDG